MTTVKARDAAERVVGVCDVLAEMVGDDLVPRRVWRTVTQDVRALRSYLAETSIPGLEA